MRLVPPAVLEPRWQTACCFQIPAIAAACCRSIYPCAGVLAHTRLLLVSSGRQKPCCPRFLPLQRSGADKVTYALLCAGLDSQGYLRERTAVAWSIQVLHIFRLPRSMHLAAYVYVQSKRPTQIITDVHLLRPAGHAVPQKYLIFAILSCVPDRQRTLRELELGRTLVKDGDKCALRYVTCFLADSSATDFLTCGERHPDWCRPYFLMRFL